MLGMKVWREVISGVTFVVCLYFLFRNLFGSTLHSILMLVGNAGLTVALYQQKKYKMGDSEIDTRETKKSESHLFQSGTSSGSASFSSSSHSARPTCPIDDVSFLSHVTFTWLAGIMRVGYERPLTQVCLYGFHILSLLG
jgi:hypothetical protein